jgi:hypothetical protein
MGKTAIQLGHAGGLLEPVAIVEILAVGRVKAWIEQAELVPAAAGEQEAGEGVGGWQQAEKLGLAGIEDGHGPGQHAGGQAEVAVRQQGAGGLGQAAQHQIPAGSHAQVAERTGNPDLIDQGMPPLLQGFQFCGYSGVITGAHAVVHDGQGLHGVVEAGQQPFDQAPVAAALPVGGQGRPEQRLSQFAALGAGRQANPPVVGSSRFCVRRRFHRLGVADFRR